MATLRWTKASELRCRVSADESADAQLTARLYAAEAGVVRYLGYDPTAGSGVEYYDGKGSPYLALRRPLVTSVTEVREDYGGAGDQESGGDAFGSTTVLTAGVDYVLSQSGILVRLNSVWPLARRRPLDRLAYELAIDPLSVMVTYVAGDPGAQAVAAEAAYLEATVLWRMRGTGIGSTVSESVDGFSRSVQPLVAGSAEAAVTLSPASLLLLRPWRRIPVGGY